MAANEYTDVAKYYDLVFTPPDLRSTINLVKQVLDKHAPGKRVLELASGTGLYLIPLKQAGFDVVGIDLSQQMLDIGKQKCEKLGINIPMHKKDMATYEEKEQFDAVMIFSSGLCYLPDQSTIEKALKHYASILKPGGILWLDLPNQDIEIEEMNNTQTVDKLMISDGQLVFVQQMYVENNKWVSDWYGFVSDKDGVRSFKHESPETIYSPERVMKTLTEAGFKILDIYGSSDGGVFDAKNSFRRVIVTQRAQ